MVLLYHKIGLFKQLSWVLPPENTWALVIPLLFEGNYRNIINNPSRILRMSLYFRIVSSIPVFS